MNLAQLRVVEAAIRHNSFERAADELHVTPSAVSQQISKFERAVDTRLFDRHARGLTVTSDARDLGQRLALAFDIVEKALENLTGERASGPVRLRIYQTWATRWLIPRLTHLHDRRPDVRVQFETGMQQAEFNRSGLDFAVQFIPDPQPDLLVTPLFPQVLVPVCAPAVAAGIQTPEMLCKHPLIASANRMDDWQIWFGAMKLVDTAPKAQLVFSNSTLAYQAALAGSGVVPPTTNKGNPWLFPGDVPGQPVKEIRRFWINVQKDAKLPDVRIHDLRHTFASLLVSGGASLEMIGKLLGHSQMQTTQRYAHLMDSPLRAGVDAVASMFRPRPKIVHDADKKSA